MYTKEQANRICWYLEDDCHEARVYEGYSGRSMYGSTTTGVVTDADAEAFKAACLRAEVEFGNRWDSMGLQTIYY